jgi:hypothetical protein
VIQRQIIYSVLNPQFDAAASRFRHRPTDKNLQRLLTVCKALECTARRPLRMLTKALRDVAPRDYVRVICNFLS